MAMRVKFKVEDDDRWVELPDGLWQFQKMHMIEAKLDLLLKVVVNKAYAFDPEFYNEIKEMIERNSASEVWQFTGDNGADNKST